MSFKKMATLLISASFLNVACSLAIISCRAEAFIEIFGFDVEKRQLYFGKKEDPRKTIGFEDPRLAELVALRASDWNFVRNRLAACKTERISSMQGYIKVARKHWPDSVVREDANSMDIFSSSGELLVSARRNGVGSIVCGQSETHAKYPLSVVQAEGNLPKAPKAQAKKDEKSEQPPKA